MPNAKIGIFFRWQKTNILYQKQGLLQFCSFLGHKIRQICSTALKKKPFQPVPMYEIHCPRSRLAFLLLLFFVLFFFYSHVTLMLSEIRDAGERTMGVLLQLWHKLIMLVIVIDQYCKYHFLRANTFAVYLANNNFVRGLLDAPRLRSIFKLSASCGKIALL